jgi:hypothetical protein
METDNPLYRVYFHDPAPPGGGLTSHEYEIRGATDVHEVLAWAEVERGNRTFVLYARPINDAPGDVHLIRLAGRDPNEDAPGSQSRLALLTSDQAARYLRRRQSDGEQAE